MSEVQRYWDAQVADFDDAPDHGLRDPIVRAAWAERLGGRLPTSPVRVADLGCGTDSVSVLLAEAADPAWPPATFDVVISRHVLWALNDLGAALDRWLALLVPAGQLLLIEGLWSTGAGLAAQETRALGRERTDEVTLTRLDDPALWGGPNHDERYLVEGRRRV